MIQTRTSPARAAAGLNINPAANLAKEIISAKQVFQWTLEGKCYTAAIEPETDSIAGQTAYDDTKQTYILTSDLTGSRIVVPISTIICAFDNTGTGIEYISVNIIRSSLGTAVLRTLSGTVMTVTNNRLDLYGGQSATAYHTATSSALDGTGDWTRIAHFACESGIYLSSENGIRGNTVFINHLQHGAPLVLCKGSSLSVIYSSSGTAPKCRVTFQWAELSASDYLP